ncbi:thioredoxin-2-like isoform X1 [Cataglyphis hispanica]|uniref:thioredoxin-2-like isoform X1 n=1 Tax=Cataglyphis hispanica TaxID=1086592 RepID=UPI00218042D4|nr:thioredoxin-2-like isoform X1 [Cataglyphis hispanica]
MITSWSNTINPNHSLLSYRSVWLLLREFLALSKSSVFYFEMGNEGEIVLVQNSDDLKSKLKEAGTSLVVIDFFAVWCGPCKMIGPLIEELSKEMQDVIFLKVDVDECEDIAAEYEITSMPTFIFIKEGKVLETFSGANYDKLKNTVEKHK